jgi:hypothetical protein
MLEIYTIILLVICGSLAFLMIKFAHSIKIQDIRIESIQNDIDRIRTQMYIKGMANNRIPEDVPAIEVKKRKAGRPKKEKTL